ncbi:MAG: MFS transporter [Betaproteobacteria bacterium]|nr:MFS transporter [Betaproteobacteria bacterium]
MAIYLVVILSILSQMGFGGSRVAVSLYALQMGASQVTVGVIAALYSLAPMFLSIYIGRLSDRMSPQVLMIWGSVMMAVALLLPVAAPSLLILCVLGFLNGLGHLVFSIPQEAAVGGVGGPQHRTRNYAFITMSWSIANFLGPLTAGILIDTIGNQRVFWVLAILVLLPIAILWRWPNLLPRTAKHGDGEHANKSVLDLWRIPTLRATFIAGGIIGSAQDLFQFYMPVYGHSVGLSASAIGMVLGMVALAAFVIRALVPLLMKKLTEGTVLLAAIFVAAFAYLLLPFFTTAVPLAVIAFLLGLGVGCAQPMLMSLLYVMAPAGRISEAVGLYKTLRSVTHVLIPLFFGSVGTAFGFKTVFLTNSGILAFGGYLQRKNRAIKTSRT